MANKYKPYKLWTRDNLYANALSQAMFYQYDKERNLNFIKKICYDKRWNPMEDYNGCNVVRDHHHPYVPCLIHDYDWVVNGGGYWTDVRFRNNLIKFGKSKFVANLYFVAVRLGWLLFYKWKK